MERRTVKICAGAGYDVVIGRNLLEACGTLIAEVTGPCKAAVITDTNVEKLYLSTVSRSLAAAGIHTERFVFPAGESSKNIDTLSAMLEFLAEKRFVRSDIVVALGGGVVGDMAGFAAAVYLRGIRYVQLPTTLLAAVDSSVGGKTAIDLAAGKNLAGAFKQPQIVVCDTDTLATLPEYEFSNGVAEAVKYGMLFSSSLFEMFSDQLSPDVLPDIIEACVGFKGKIVEMDEFDTGERRFLNLGHTIGHAIEKCSGYTIGHGHAVAAGMAMISRAGEALGITKSGTTDAVAAVLLKHDLPVNTTFDPEALTAAALADKKRLGGEITLVLPEMIGKCILRTEPVDMLSKYIELGRGV